MLKNIVSTVLLILVVAAVAGAIATLIPAHGPIPNDLGYHSLCPFAPWSPLILLAGAGVLWVVRQYLRTRVE